MNYKDIIEKITDIKSNIKYFGHRNVLSKLNQLQAELELQSFNKYLIINQEDTTNIQKTNLEGLQNKLEILWTKDVQSSVEFLGFKIPVLVKDIDISRQEKGEQYLFGGTSLAYNGVTTDMVMVINEDIKGDSTVFDLNFPEYTIDVYEDVEFVEGTGYNVTGGAICLNRAYEDDSVVTFIANPTITNTGRLLYSLTYFNNGMQGVQPKYDTMHYFPAGSVIMMRSTNNSGVDGKVTSTFTWYQ